MNSRYFQTKHVARILGLFLWILATAAANAQTLEQVKAQFVGYYELVSFVSFPATGGQVTNDYIGRIIYDQHDNMSAIGMPAGAPDEAARAGESGSRGFAYWGKVSWDLDRGVVIHHVEGSPTRNTWVGEDNVRYFELDGDLLSLSLRDDEGRTTGTLTWRKITSR